MKHTVSLELLLFLVGFCFMILGLGTYWYWLIGWSIMFLLLAVVVGFFRQL